VGKSSTFEFLLADIPYLDCIGIFIFCMDVGRLNRRGAGNHDAAPLSGDE
jgi:hypothetical protein